MAKPVYSTLFAGERVSPAGPSLSIGPIGDDVVVVRDVRLLDFDALVGDQIQFVMMPADVTAFVYTVTVIGNYIVEWSGRFVIPSGSFLSVIASTGTWNVFVSGYNLTGP